MLKDYLVQKKIIFPVIYLPYAPTSLTSSQYI